MIFIEVGFIGRRHSHPARLILRGQNQEYDKNDSDKINILIINFLKYFFYRINFENVGGVGGLEIKIF